MPLSDRKKRKIREQKKLGIEMAIETLEALRAKQQSGKNLNTKELDSMKWAIKYIDDTEHEVVQKIEDVLPEGELKQWVDNHIRLQNKMIEFTGNRRYKLTREENDKVVDEVGYYRCGLCGELHGKDRKCMFDEYISLKEKNINNEEENDIEDEIDA